MSRFGCTALATPSRDGRRFRGSESFSFRTRSHCAPAPMFIVPAWGRKPSESSATCQSCGAYFCPATTPVCDGRSCSRVQSLLRFRFPLVVGHCFGPNSCALRTAVLLLRFLLHTPEKYAPCGFRLPRKLFLSRSPTPARKKKLSRSPRKSTTWACEQRPLA